MHRLEERTREEVLDRRGEYAIGVVFQTTGSAGAFWVAYLPEYDREKHWPGREQAVCAVRRMWAEEWPDWDEDLDEEAADGDSATG